MGIFRTEEKPKKEKLTIIQILDIASKLQALYANNHNNAQAVMTTAKAYGLDNMTASKILALISTYSEQDWLAALNKE